MSDTALPPGVGSQQCRCGGSYFVAHNHRGDEIWVDPVVHSAGNLAVTVTDGKASVAEVSQPQAAGMRSAGKIVYAHHGGGTRGNSSCQKKLTR